MALQLWQEKSRNIKQRVIVEGTLILQTPAHFGNGDDDAFTDMPLLVDSFDGKTPLLTGSTLAGALRSYLYTIEMGYRPETLEKDDPKYKQRKQKEREGYAAKLFGSIKEDNNGPQSPVIVEDAFGRNFTLAIRHNVRLDAETRTAADNLLFDTCVWEAGTTFDIRLELAITANEEESLLPVLATALNGLSNGSITLGKRKRRGYGQIKVKEWRVKNFELTQPKQLCDYLLNGSKPLKEQTNVQRGNDIRDLLRDELSVQDKRQSFQLQAIFSLDGSLMIRSGEGKDDLGPDMVHLHGRQPNGENEPVLSGTSLAGALRARAAKIVRTLGGDSKVVDELFGPDLNEKQNGKKKTPKASKLTVRERVVENGITDLVQNRVSIDRFTGGARDTALFDEQPVWGKPETLVTVDLHLVNPEIHEIGLLLLLLKDLWTRDLALGGESSIGRGRLKGQFARLEYFFSGNCAWWEIGTNSTRLETLSNITEGKNTGRDILEDCVGMMNASFNNQGLIWDPTKWNPLSQTKN